jgi:hypothetical protein
MIQPQKINTASQACNTVFDVRMLLKTYTANKMACFFCLFFALHLILNNETENSCKSIKIFFQ